MSDLLGPKILRYSCWFRCIQKGRSLEFCLWGAGACRPALAWSRGMLWELIKMCTMSLEAHQRGYMHVHTYAYTTNNLLMFMHGINSSVASALPRSSCLHDLAHKLAVCTCNRLRKEMERRRHTHFFGLFCDSTDGQWLFNHRFGRLDCTCHFQYTWQDFYGWGRRVNGSGTPIPTQAWKHGGLRREQSISMWVGLPVALASAFTVIVSLSYYGCYFRRNLYDVSERWMDQSLLKTPFDTRLANASAMLKHRNKPWKQSFRQGLWLSLAPVLYGGAKSPKTRQQGYRFYLAVD